MKEIKDDLWVDGQYLVRRARAVVGNTDMTIDYSDYGKPVDVTAPHRPRTSSTLRRR